MSDLTRRRGRTLLCKVRQPNLLRGIVCCSTRERPLRIQATRKYGYYVETSRYRGKGCVFSRGRVRMDFLDKLVQELLQKVCLPEAWQKDIEQEFQNMDVVRQIENRRMEIDEELRRAGWAFADGAFGEEDYDCQRMRLISEKDGLIVPDIAKALEMGMQLENISDFFDDATNDEKNRILYLLFEAIYYDFEKKRMVRFKPLAEYAPLSGWIEKEGFI